MMGRMELPRDDDRTPGGWSLALILFIGLAIPLSVLAVVMIMEAAFTHGLPGALLVALVFAVALAFVLWVGYSIGLRRNR